MSDYEEGAGYTPRAQVSLLKNLENFTDKQNESFYAIA
jgi:hypothetical protein